MKSPLAKAFSTSLLATSSSCCGSAVEAITRSTWKSPAPGSGAGVSGITRTPAIRESGPELSIWSCCVVFLRSLQGLVTMPPKPPVGKVIWKALAVSGNELETS